MVLCFESRPTGTLGQAMRRRRSDSLIPIEALAVGGQSQAERPTPGTVGLLHRQNVTRV